MDENSLLYWYPKIRDLVPTPKTAWVKIPENAWAVEWLWKPVPKSFKSKLRQVARDIGYPLFMRTDYFSGKHNYKDTCYVESEDKLMFNLIRLIEANEMTGIVGLPISAIVLRELVELDWRFHAFVGELPIAPEVRYFIKKNKVQCCHFYWVEDAIRFVKEKIDWRKELAEMKDEAMSDTEHRKYANRVAKVIDGYWSIDFAKSRSSDWYLIDMAIGNESYHPSDCKFLSREEREVMLIIEGRKRSILSDIGEL
jgi:hypothetical protein